MKKICSILMISMLLMAICAGCGNNTDSGSGSSKKEQNTAQTAKPTEAATSEASPSESSDASPTGETKTENKSKKVYKGKQLKGKHHIEIEIKDYGTIKLELDADTAPITVTNFIKLAQEGFYDGLTFHRIISGFMIQGGDPEGTGMGDSDETIKGEFSANGVENNIEHKRGVISMARSNAPDSASSQFFIVHQDSPHLNGQYAAFGSTTEGIEIVDKICENTEVQDPNSGLVAAEKQPVITTITVID